MVRKTKGENHKNNPPKVEEQKEEKKFYIDGRKLILKLDKKIKVEDEDLDSITVDLDSLNGRSICDAEIEYLARYNVPLAGKEYSTGYQAAVVAHASGVPYEEILSLGVYEFRALVSYVEGFLTA